MAKRGQKTFGAESDAIKFLIIEKKRLELGENVDLSNVDPDCKGKIYAFMNLRRAGEMTNRVNGDMLDLSNLPIRKRGRPPKNKTE